MTEEKKAPYGKKFPKLFFLIFVWESLQKTRISFCHSSLMNPFEFEFFDDTLSGKF